MGVLKKYNGTDWEEVLIQRYDGSSFVDGTLRWWNGDEWIDVGRREYFTSSVPKNPVTNRGNFHTPRSPRFIEINNRDYQQLVVGANGYTRENLPSGLTRSAISFPQLSGVTVNGLISRKTIRDSGFRTLQIRNLATFNRRPVSGAYSRYCSSQREFEADFSSSTSLYGFRFRSSTSFVLEIVADYQLDRGIYEDIGRNFDFEFILYYQNYEQGFTAGVQYRSNGTDWMRV